MKLSKALLLCIFTFLSWQSVLAQSILVLDADNNSPIERVEITSTSSLGPLFTNDKGQAKLSKLGKLDSNTTIVVKSIGYEEMTITLNTLKESNYIVHLKPSALSLDQVVVSATKWTQSARELPYKISSISNKTVKLQNPQTTADLLGQSGEVFIQKSQQGGGSPMIRGFAANRLLISIDGIRMNNAIFRSGNIQNVISLDPFVLDKTEVYFGPNSVIYGSDAIGGVMSFSTKKPQFSHYKDLSLSGSAATRYSSVNNEFSKHFDINTAWKKFALLTSISHFDYGDLKMGSKGSDDYLDYFRVERIDGQDVIIQNDNPELQDGTGFQQINLMQKLRFRPNSLWEFNYAFHYSETSNYGRYDRLILTRDSGEPRSAEWYYGPQVWQMNQLSVTNTNSIVLYDKATLRLSHQLFKESRNNRDLNSNFLISRNESVNAYSLNFDLLKRISERHKVFYGLEAVYNDVFSEGLSTNVTNQEIKETSDRYPQSTWQSYALYLNHEWELGTNLTSQAGLRYNLFALYADFRDNLAYFPLPSEESTLNNDALTGSIGFVYTPNSSLKLQANIGTAFRAPNVDDIGKVFDSGDQIVVVPNPRLNAEYAYNAEFGIAKILNESLKLDFTVFYTYLNNALVRRPYLLNGQDSIVYDNEMSQVQAVQNASFGLVYGLQAGFKYRISSDFYLSSTFNYQKGKEELTDGTVNASRHAAPWFGISKLEYLHKSISLQINVQYNGQVSNEDLNPEEANKAYLYAMDESGNPYSPGWYVLNFKALYQFNKYLSMSAGVENITDQRYRPYSSGLTAAGRNIIMSLNANF